MKEVCRKHGEYEKRKIDVLGYEFSLGCPVCIAEAEAEEKKQNEQALAEFNFNNKVKRGVEPEFFNATLDQYKPENESEEMALKAAKALEEGRLKKVLLLGSNGTGKTLLACALVNKLNGCRITMYELSAKIRAGYNSGTSEIDILNELLEYPFIAIDEIGRTKGSESELNWLSYLIDKCHVRGKRLMLISNKSSAKNLPPERRHEAIELYLPNDAISRLRQNSYMVEIKGRDRRGTNTPTL